MSIFTQENLATALKVTSVCVLGTYAGGSTAMACPIAIGIKALEKPSFRLKALRCMVKNSFYFPITGLLADVTAVGAYLATRGTQHEDTSILAGAAAGCFIFPYTYFVMYPIYNKIVEDTEMSEEDSEKVVNQWFKYHNIRAVCGLAAFGFVAGKLVCRN